MKDIIDLFRNEELKDILQIGVAIYEDNSKMELIPNYNIVFLDFGSAYLKLEAIEQNSKLKVCVVKDVDYSEIPEKEELPAYQNSITKIVLIDDDFIKTINSIEIYESEVINDTALICKSLLLNLNNQSVFFDPSFYWGINIGSEAQLNEWLKNCDAKKLLKPIVCNLSTNLKSVKSGLDFP